RVVVVSEGDLSTCADAVNFKRVASSEPADIIIDNGDAGTSSTGIWEVSTRPNAYGDDSLYSWTPGGLYTYEAAVNGAYTVSLWWTDHPNQRSSSVPVEIYDGDVLLDTVYVNQQTNGGQWNDIGEYEFSGTARVVVVSEGDLSTCGDAVSFKRVASAEPADIIIDNGDAGTSSTGIWEVSTRPKAFGEDSLYSWTPGGLYTYEAAAINGTYSISLWWTDHPNQRSSSVPVEIYDGDVLLDTVYINQQTNGGQWNDVGQYQFSGTARVVIVSEGDLSTCADAVRFSY
ncbi:MAG: hypothetical protein R6U40_09640, partial [Desulfobacterales bacterium]